MGRTASASRLAVLWFLLACASPAPPAAVDRARHTLEGFRDAHPRVVQALDGAAAWAVFSGVVDGAEDCGHDGVLFLADGGTRPVHLQCADRPVAPGGIAYHQLVILREPGDVARLEAGPLDLADARQVTTLDGDWDVSAPRLLLTTGRATLLFEHRRLRQVLALQALRDAAPPPPRTP